MSNFTEALVKSLKERGLKMSGIAPNLPAGAYEGTIFSQRFYENDNGTAMFEVGMENLVKTDDPDGFNPVSGETRRYIRLPLTDRSQKWTVRKLRKIGFEGAPSQFNAGEQHHISVVGNTAELWMKHGSYGEDWDITLPRDSGAMDSVKAKTWDARFSHLMPFKPKNDQDNNDPPTGQASSF